ncbi:Hypothetical predicted protein, partial [Olea europaea subsp. europaea]
VRPGGRQPNLRRHTPRSCHSASPPPPPALGGWGRGAVRHMANRCGQRPSMLRVSVRPTRPAVSRDARR